MPALEGIEFSERFMKMFEEWSEVTARHYAMVGLVASNWAYFEAVIDDWTLRLAEIEPNIGACLTAQIAGSGRKMDAFISLLRLLKVGAPTADEWDKFAKRVAGLAEQRNRAIHDPWFLHDPEKPKRLEVTARRKLRNEMVPMSTIEVAALAANIETLTLEFDKIVMEIALDGLATSLKK